MLYFYKLVLNLLCLRLFKMIIVSQASLEAAGGGEGLAASSLIRWPLFDEESFCGEYLSSESRILCQNPRSQKVS